jgi:RHS repeat-associated protein
VWQSLNPYPSGYQITNLITNGTNKCERDADDRLIQVTYPGTGNNSQFTYDGLSHCAKIVETIGGTVASTKQFIWCGEDMCEARDASSNLLSQYFVYGQTISGSNYFYTTERPPSVVEMTDSSGNDQAAYKYDPYGRVTQTQGSLASDFQYAGYYYHAPSGLNLAAHRAYSPILARWLNRDPIEESGGINLFAYVHNDPIDHRDPSGLWQWYGYWGGPGWVNNGPGNELGDFPYRPGQPGFWRPLDPRDRCYYWHDVCLHNAGISPNRTQRKCDRRNCDVALAQCLQYVSDTFPGQFGFISPGEISKFRDPRSPNDNYGPDPDPSHPVKPYPYLDPGVGNPGIPQ